MDQTAVNTKKPRNVGFYQMLNLNTTAVLSKQKCFSNTQKLFACIMHELFYLLQNKSSFSWPNFFGATLYIFSLFSSRRDIVILSLRSAFDMTLNDHVFGFFLIDYCLIHCIGMLSTFNSPQVLKRRHSGKHGLKLSISFGYGANQDRSIQIFWPNLQACFSRRAPLMNDLGTTNLISTNRQLTFSHYICIGLTC